MIYIRACTILCLALLGPLCASFPAFSDEIPAAESQSPPVMPKVTSHGKGNYYPDQAKRQNAQGRFLLGFKIDDRGRAAQINIELAEGNKILSDSAVALLKGVVFERPTVPEPTATSQRYRMSVVFELTPCGRLQHFDVPKDAQMSVCGSLVRRL
jgi:TonB family protein